MSKNTIAAIVLLLLVVTLAHTPAARSWWTYDDPQLLLFARKYSLAETLFDPGKYQTLATHAFTPILPLSLELDVVRGVDSAAIAYAHQIALVALASIFFVILLQRHVPLLLALAGGVLLGSSWMMTYAARTLMIRHYVEGLIFALGALLLWRSRRPLVVAASAALYLVAMLEKEVYAPLPLLLMAADVAQKLSVREIARRLIAPSVAAVIYLVWRFCMIGTTGYGISLEPGDLAGLPTAIFRALSFSSPVVVAALLIALAVSVIRSLRGARAASVAFLVLGFILLPIVPVAGNFEWRYGFVASALMIFFAVVAVAQLPLPSRWTLGFLALLSAVSIVVSWRDGKQYEQMNAAMITEGKYVWRGDASGMPLHATSPGWYLSGLRDLRAIEKRERSPFFFVSPAAALLGVVDPVRVVRADVSGRLVPAAAPTASGRVTHDRTLRFEVELTKHAHSLSWRFDGPPGASWAFLSLPEYAEYSLPPAGSRGVPAAPEQQYCRILVTLPDGRWSATDPLPIPMREGTSRWP